MKVLRAECEISLITRNIICSYYNKPTQEGIYQHFKRVCNEASPPSDLLQRSRKNISNMPVPLQLYERVLKKYSYIKESGDIVQAMQNNKRQPKDF
jgi:4-hydroxy-tetrahydrodipicolinate synthase